MKAEMNLKRFYLLSFTWGFLPSFTGLLLSIALLLTGHKPKSWGPDLYFEVGKGWGGFSMGPFFFVCRDCSTYLLNHELGHSLQNCRLGLLMPFIVDIPSTCWYWSRRCYARITGHQPKKDYYAPWFEASASRLGTEYYEKKIRPKKG